MIDKRVIDISSNKFEGNLINLVFNRLHEMYVPLDLEPEIRDRKNAPTRLKVTKPNTGYLTPLLNIELRPINLTTDTDYGWTPTVYLSTDSRIRSDQDQLAISSSAMRIFVRMEFALSCETGPPKEAEPTKPEDLTTQSTNLMADLREILSRQYFVGKCIGTGNDGVKPYVSDAGIVRDFFDPRVRNTKDDLYVVQFMAAYSYQDAQIRQ